MISDMAMDAAGAGNSEESAVFELTVTPRSVPRAFQVEVLRSPPGQASAVADLPVSALLERWQHLLESIRSHSMQMVEEKASQNSVT
jgi:hypothetical protein